MRLFFIIYLNIIVIMAKNMLDMVIDGEQYTPRPRGVCYTSTSDAKKMVQCDDFGRVDGVTILVKFSNNNTSENPTLNVNNTGDGPIYFNGSSLDPSNYWSAGAVIEFMWGENRWNILGCTYNSSGVIKADRNIFVLNDTNSKYGDYDNGGYIKCDTFTVDTNLKVNGSISSKSNFFEGGKMLANKYASKAELEELSDKVDSLEIGDVISVINIGDDVYVPTGGVVNLPEYPTSLPADGGNADTVGGKGVNDFASVDHTHTDFDRINTELEALSNKVDGLEPGDGSGTECNVINLGYKDNLASAVEGLTQDNYNSGQIITYNNRLGNTEMEIEVESVFFNGDDGIEQLMEDNFNTYDSNNHNITEITVNISYNNDNDTIQDSCTFNPDPSGWEYINLSEFMSYYNRDLGVLIEENFGEYIDSITYDSGYIHIIFKQDYHDIQIALVAYDYGGDWSEENYYINTLSTNSTSTYNYQLIENEDPKTTENWQPLSYPTISLLVEDKESVYHNCRPIINSTGMNQFDNILDGTIVYLVNNTETDKTQVMHLKYNDIRISIIPATDLPAGSVTGFMNYDGKLYKIN